MSDLELSGYRGGAIVWSSVVYIAIDEGAIDQARSYAYDRDSEVFKIECLLEKPLILDTPARVWTVWDASGGLYGDWPFYSATERSSQGILNAWASREGYDSIVVLESAFEGEEGYRWAAGTFGEPQAALFRPDFQILRIHRLSEAAA